MKKYWPVIITFLIIPLFVLSGIICCCFTSEAQAQEVASSCHSESHDNASKDTSQTEEGCDCASVKLLIPKNVSNTQAVTSPAFNQIADASPSQRFFYRAIAMTPAYHEPPNFTTHSIPLYLQNSNLQL